MSNEQSGHNMQRARTVVCGPSTEFNIDKCQSQIRADITVSEFSTVRVWGQVKNTRNEPVPGALLKLVRVDRNKHGECEYHGLAHTISDCDGFYQFDVCASTVGTCYRILANKSAIGPERVIFADESCHVCHEEPKCEEKHMCKDRPRYPKECECNSNIEKKCHKDDRYR